MSRSTCLPNTGAKYCGLSPYSSAVNSPLETDFLTFGRINKQQLMIGRFWCPTCSTCLHLISSPFTSASVLCLLHLSLSMFQSSRVIYSYFLQRNNLPAVRQYLETFAINVYLKFPSLVRTFYWF